MNIEVNAQEGGHFLTAFAEAVGGTVENNRVIIPEKYGSGYVMGFLFSNQLRIIVRNYKLNEDVVIKRQPNDVRASMILLSFKNILNETRNKSDNATEVRRSLPSVTISTQGLEPELSIPGHVSFNAINLAIEASYLKDLLATNIENSVLRNIIDNSQPLVFEQLVSARLQEVVSAITNSLVSSSLQNLFYKIKSEELIYHLLTELMERQNNNLQALNMSDVKMLYAVRDKLIINLAEAPTLDELSAYAGMSKSKLKRLFTQIFGDSVYSYYQTVRMKEAAYLLKQKKQSVSEVGFALGFTNLSHFTRIFETHVGMKPKKYSVL